MVQLLGPTANNGSIDNVIKISLETNIRNETNITVILASTDFVRQPANSASFATYLPSTERNFFRSG